VPTADLSASETLPINRPLRVVGYFVNRHYRAQARAAAMCQSTEQQNIYLFVYIMPRIVYGLFTPFLYTYRK